MTATSFSQPTLQIGPFAIRPYRTGDEGKINDAFNAVFGQNRSLEEWKWKFDSVNPSRIIIAVDQDEQVVTHYAVLTDEFQYKGKRYIGGHSVDTYSKRRSDAVRTRLFEKTVGLFFEIHGRPGEVDLMYGFPGTRILKLGHMKLDYGEPLAVPYWEKNAPASRHGLKSAVVDRLPTSEKLNALWKRASGRYSSSIIRDGRWFEKRYFSRPDNAYRLVVYSKWWRWTAAAVVKDEGHQLFVIDLVWDGRDEAQLRDLLYKIEGMAADLGRTKVAAWFSGDGETEQTLESMGWIRKAEPQGLHMVVKTFHPDIDRNNLLHSFYLTKGCTDII